MGKHGGQIYDPGRLIYGRGLHGCNLVLPERASEPPMKLRLPMESANLKLCGFIARRQLNVGLHVRC
jgi:hypothetical protein